MDLNLLRSVITVVAFVMFAGVVWWACSRARRADFDEAAKLPFEAHVDRVNTQTHESTR